TASPGRAAMPSVPPNTPARRAGRLHPPLEASMSLSRRTLLKIGVGTGAVPLLNAIPFAKSIAQPATRGTRSGRDGDEMLRARPLPLESVRLTGGPLRHAQELDIKSLLDLEPDRMLAHYRERAGLKPKAEGYGGW